ncbi:hypothetical protein HG536_0H01000 [Torulaspora globosa]|uniref:E3 ubiquitin-protein ligase listerin n=1 Tax=Torulaspora globosa TaxID=48254 RepID=A0A7G3ZMI9_9SACH|nr:uncharacterized protein HG536_0H01000 [Torulaspora globosa]QLL34725.1 hypothetical protein HG536_0H01000 [Torulaspora globosa]
MSFGGVNTFQQYSTDFGFGHNGVKLSFNYFDGFPEPSLLNSLASNDLKLIFKSLLKRDETTKEKALNDLLKLVENYTKNEGLFDSDIFFLCWSQVYPKLLVSESKTIRVSSHLVTSKLVKLLNKKVSKFLRDVMPLLLLGTCDTDSSVSKACNAFLNDIFDCNTSKVNSLWSVFQEDILKITEELVVKENEETISDERFVGKEDSLLRFNRLITSAMQLLTNLISSDSFDSVKHEEITHDVLISECLWQLLSLTNTHFLKSYEAALVLQKTLYKNNLLQRHKDVLKLSTKKLLKSLSHVNAKNSLKVAHLAGPILDNLTMLDHYQKGKIWTYDKSARDRFLQFVVAASKNPVPGFFDALYKFYEESSSHELLDEKKQWLPLWRGSNDTLREKQFLGRHGPELLGEFWANYRKFISHCSVPDVSEVAKEDVLNILRSGKQLSRLPSLKAALIDFLDPEIVANQIKAAVNQDDKEAGLLLNNLMLLLCSAANGEAALHDVASAMLELMSKDQDDFGPKKQKVLEVYSYFVNSGIISVADEVTQFVYEVPTWIDKNTYKSLSIFISDYSKSVIAHKDKNFATVMEDFITAASSAEGIAESRIVRTLNLLDNGVSPAVLSSTIVQDFVQNYINSYAYNDYGELFNGRLIDEHNVVQLYEKSVEGKQTEFFLHHLSSLNYHALEALLTESDFLSGNLFEGSLEQAESIYQLIKPLLNNGPIVKNLANAIISYAKTKPRLVGNDFVLRIAEELITLQRDGLDIFVPPDLELVFFDAVPFIDYRLALVSSLKLNTHLFELSSDELNLSKAEQLIRYGLFLDALISRVPAGLDNKLSVFLTMVCDLAEDFNCLSEDPQEEITEFKNTLFRGKLEGFSFEDVTDLVCQVNPNDERPLDILSHLIADSSSITVTYYHLRILQKILQNKIDSITSASFIRKLPSIERFVISTIRSKDKSQHNYLLCGIILSAAEKFTDLEIFGKLRNVLASECIGVKENELLEKSYKNIILLSNLLQSQGSTESPPPIPYQRLNMMLNSLSQWLDSDLAYESGFTQVRLSLLKLCALLARTPSITEASKGFYEFSMALLSDSLSMCLLDDTYFLLELRLYCLVLHEELTKSVWKQHLNTGSDEMLSGLVELSLINFATEKNNQISAVFYRTLFRVLSGYQVKQVVKFYPDVLSAFLSNEGFANINRTRMLFAELKRLVIERQKDAFLELEFEKQKKQKKETEHQSDEGAGEDLPVNDKFELPPGLIEKMCVEIPEDYLECEDEYGFLKYLWFWDLAFCFFNDASYDLRQKFIDQLRSRNLITIFFDFVSDQIDLQDTRFWSEAGSAAIQEYSVQSNDFSPYREDLYPECKKLLGHSMYNMFLNVGSLTSNWWLNIKDRTLQAKIEKFVTTFISPILITKELDEVAEKTSKLESNDTALTIKINKVTNEIKASYLIDEQRLELSFKMPANYPLTNVEAIGLSRVGISEQKWKQWILSAQRVITGMNGSVVDSLDLFSKNVNLQFSGFEECAICYSILHVVDRKLPTKTCPTCNNKFHGACLYKWFRSSGNNTCPLCRSEIPFRR